MNYVIPGFETVAVSQKTADTEDGLINTFPDLVDDIKVEQVAVRWSRKRPVIRPEAFGFIALVPIFDDGIRFDDSTKSLNSSGYISLSRTHPDISYCGDEGSTYLDSRQAVGLTYDKKLIAVAGGGIDFDGRVKITQLQDVTGVRKCEVGSPDYEQYKGTGLHNRLLWRHTLVRAWEQIGLELDASVIGIQSWENNVWRYVTDDMDRGKAGYDMVAQRLYFTQDPDTRDWYRPITSLSEQLVLSKS